MSVKSTSQADAAAPKAPDAEAVMLEAVRLAGQARFRTAPNPCVGAVLTLDGRIVARGWHQACGRPHAEVETIADARRQGIDLRRCILWVTLEPCNHRGRTPPCTEAILEAGIPEVVVGCPDPNPDVQGGGIARLRERGVTVRENVALEACRDLLADFVVWKTAKRPFVLLKLAATLDGRIATRTGHSRWVSGEASRRRVHELRSVVQAVLVGGNTFREDDPGLDCRLEGAAPERQPLAVICGTRLPEPGAPLPRLLRQRPARTVFWTSEAMAGSDTARWLRGLGCRVLGLPPAPRGGLDLRAGLQGLYADDTCAYLLCEGGGALGLSLLESGLCDELLLFTAPKILGDAQARPLFSGRAPITMQQALELRIVDAERLGEDMVLRLRHKPGP